MRKFNLKGKVAQKLKGLETAVSEDQNTENDTNVSAQSQPATVALEKGEIHYAWRTDVG